MTDDSTNLPSVTEPKDLVVIQILALISGGLSKAKACKQFDLAVNTFDARLKAKPDILAEFMLSEKQRLSRLFRDITEARESLLIDLIVEAKNADGLKMSDKLALDKRLTAVQERMERELGFVPEEPDEGGNDPDIQDAMAQDFIKKLKGGPKLKKATSITTLEFESDEQEPEIIEGNVTG